jgi:hypothetical protein
VFPRDVCPLEYSCSIALLLRPSRRLHTTLTGSFGPGNLAQPGSTARLHIQAAQPGSTSKQHSKAVQPGHPSNTARQRSQVAHPSSTVRKYSQVIQATQPGSAAR